MRNRTCWDRALEVLLTEIQQNVDFLDFEPFYLKTFYLSNAFHHSIGQKQYDPQRTYEDPQHMASFKLTCNSFKTSSSLTCTFLTFI